MMRAKDLVIGQRFIANDGEFICCGPCDNGLILAAEASGKVLTCTFTPEHTVKLKSLDALERFVASVTLPPLPPLPDGYELAPDYHVLDGDSYRIDGCVKPPYFWQRTTTEDLTVGQFVKDFPYLNILAVARRKTQELPPLPDGYELAPDDHVLDGDSYRIDGCDPKPRGWLFTSEDDMTVKELKEACPNLNILAVARRKTPKYRPYNTDEMRALVGKIVVCCEGDYHLVTDWDAEDNTVYIADGYYCADDVLAEYNTLDGKPCGVAE